MMTIWREGQETTFKMECIHSCVGDDNWGQNDCFWNRMFTEDLMNAIRELFPLC